MNAVAARVRAVPTLLRIGFSEAVAYRAELLVWILSSTMPLIMLALWTAVARDAPVGRFGQRDFTAYFLATFIVRQVTGAWVSWEMNWEVRQGTIAARLLRPMPPMVAYAAETLAAIPMRLVIALPVAGIALAITGGRVLPHDPRMWASFAVSLAGAWGIAFLASFGVGCLAFYFESSIKVMDLYLVLFFVLSGYLFPMELLPATFREIADWLPFRYQIGLPVEILTSAVAPREAAVLIARQWGFVAVLFGIAVGLWRGGLRRFAAYGG